MPKQKTIYELLSERELERMKGSNIDDKPLTETTVGELMHIGMILDDAPNLSEIEALTILKRRSA